MNKLDAYTCACFLIHKSTKWDESHYWNILLAKHLGYCLLIRNIKTGNTTYHNLFCKLNLQSSRNKTNNFEKTAGKFNNFPSVEIPLKQS